MPPRPRAALLYCLAALLLFAFLSYTAVSAKSPTFDEPAHALASYVALRHGDFRVEPDHPPLWKFWAALPVVLTGRPVDANLDTPVCRGIRSNIPAVFTWAVVTAYHTPGNDPDRLIPPARAMMLLCGVALGAVVALFAGRAAGPLAACVAVTLFAFDPNFLAHAPLVKNDVALALLTTTLAYALYRAGQSLTLPRAAAVALLCAACATTKFTGLLAAPITLLALATRALLPAPWPVLRRTLATRPRRLLAAAGTCLACALLACAAIWAVYLFRFDPSPDPAVHYDTPRFLAKAAAEDLAARGVASPSPADLAAWRPSAPLRAALFCLDHRLLPEAYVEGLIVARAYSYNRPAYALGSVYTGGRWYYFPLALLAKTPLATLAALALLPLAAFLIRPPTPRSTWLWACLLVPVALFLLTSIPSGINIGLRHIFPVLPPLYVAAGVCAARLYAARPRVLRPALVVLALTLSAETLSAFPDFIPFFNAAAGGYRGGLHLLGDSNLDWGQDLPALSLWQQRHPDRTLHLAYFGLADPAYYGIHYLNAPRGYAFGPPREPALPTTGVLAVSASVLQGVSDPYATANPYVSLLRRQPTEILGGSIYLYDLDQR